MKQVTSFQSRLSYRSLVGIVAFLFTLFGMPGVVNAVGLVEAQFYSNNDIFYYSPEGTCSQPTPSSSTTSRGEKISVFGDSLTVGMRDRGELGKKLTDNGWEVQTIEAEGGENIAWARNKLKDTGVKKNVSNSDTVLIAMGTNADDNPKDQVDGIIEELNDINPDLTIYWVNIFTPRDNAYRDNMNVILDSKSSSLGFTVIDWHSEVKDRTDYYEFIPNNIHHTELGYERKADFVMKSVSEPSVESQVENTVLESKDCVCTTSASSGDSIGQIPEPWKSLIGQAATQYDDVDPRLVAATLYIENREWPDYNKDWEASSAGAKGPWQFIDSTWATMGQDGDGDGIKDPNNPKDAVLAAFIHQKGSAGKPLIDGFSGDLNTGLELVFKRDKQNLLSFMANYNGSGAPDGVALKDFPRGQNADYVLMAYYVIGSNFSQTWDPTTGEVVSIGDSTPTVDDGDCGSQSAANGYVNTEGFSFPIGLPKDQITYGYGKLPCTRDSCHHDNTYAFDLFGEVGTPVFAIEAGTIEGLKDDYDGQAGCFSIHLAGKSGWKYWYGHIQNPVITQGQSVQPGEALAAVGESKCAKGTAPHLHIDRGSPKGRTGGEDCCRDKGINDLINSLYADMPG